MFVLSSPSAIAPALVPDMVTLCDSDCGYYDNYILATLHPMNNDLLGIVPFTLSTGLATFTIPALYATTFDVWVLQCQTEFSPITQTSSAPIF